MFRAFIDARKRGREGKAGKGESRVYSPFKFQGPGSRQCDDGIERASFALGENFRNRSAGAVVAKRASCTRGAKSREAGRSSDPSRNSADR